MTSTIQYREQAVRVVDVDLVSVRVTDDEVVWRVTDAADADWPDVLREVDARVRAQATPAQICAWEDACARGRGPDADADVGGERHVRLEV